MKKIYTNLLPLLLLNFSGVFYAEAQLTSWTTETTSTGVPSGRDETNYTKCNSNFYLLGGRGGAQIEEYNPTTETWTGKAKFPIQLHHFQGVEFNGKIYVMGAFTGGYPDETPVQKIYIYNPVADVVTEGDDIPTARLRGAGGAVTYNNKIYLISGLQHGHIGGQVPYFDEYNPATGEWKILPDVPNERDHFNAAVSGNKLYVVSGRITTSDNVFGNTVPEVDVYDFSTGQWETYPNNLPTPRAGAAVLAHEDEILVIGGESGSQTIAHNETEALNITTRTWTQLATLNKGRHGTQAISYEGKVYIASGVANKGGSGVISDQEILNFGIVSAGTSEENLSRIVTVYPNPFTNILTICNNQNHNSNSVEIYDMHGKNCFSKTIENGQSLNLESVLASGIYLLKVKSGDKEEKTIIRKE